MKKISISDPEYPGLLKEIGDPPGSFYFLGSLPEKKEPAISVVGTRKATINGRVIAEEIAKGLASQGITVVSGLALGIDSAAHEGALAANGRTVAVLGGGLNSIYPRQNEDLAKRIVKNKGALISEYDPDTSPKPEQFLERNRVIAGLGAATVVIEAPFGSGALVTAKFAIYAGRDVFVVPGPVNHPNYKGSHMLLREGARLVTNTQEIMIDLGMASHEAGT